MHFVIERSKCMASIKVTVVYALPDRQTILDIAVPSGSTVQDVIDISAIKQDHPELKDVSLTVGIYGKKVELSHIVFDKDRVEIYRPLQIDPKTARLKRAKQ